MKDFGLLFLSILFFSSLISCELEDEDKSGKPKPGYLNEMPEETNIGANTFGCYVNGELRASQGKYQEEGVEPYLWSASYVNGFWDKYKNDTCMKFDIVTKDAVYYLRMFGTPFIGTNYCNYFVDFKDVSKRSIGDDATIDIIRFDTTEHVISGKFNEIKIPPILDNFMHEDTLHITQGQFDIKYGQNF